MENGDDEKGKADYEEVGEESERMDDDGPQIEPNSDTNEEKPKRRTRRSRQ